MSIRYRYCFGIALLSAIGFFPAQLLGQGAKVRSPYQPIAEEDSDHPAAREQWFLRGRVIPGKSAAALRYRAHQQKMQLRATRIAAAQQRGAAALAQPLGVTGTGSWTPLGPSPLASDASGFGYQDYGWVSGRATAVAADPGDSTGNTVYAGGAYGGVWKSTNAASGSYGNTSGVTWTPLIDGQATLAVGAIAVQPGNSNVVLVGTGEPNSSADSYYGLGILRSTNGGASWTLISTANGGTLGTLSFNGLAGAKIAFSTAQTSRVVAAMATSSVGAVDGLITSNTQRGLYTSTDSGQTWTFNQLVDPGGGQVTPATSATSVVYNAVAGKFFAAIRYHGFYSSSDGVTWTRLAAQPGGSVLSTTACPPNYQNVTTPCPIYRAEIAVVPGRNEMYMWYVSVNFATGDAIDQGIWKSTDGGSTWTAISDIGITSCGDPSGCGVQQGTYNLELAAVPNGSTATDLYAGAINLYKCSINTTSNPTCATSPFINLTHVYGCTNPGQLAHVHPDQHDLDFIVTGGKDIMYFANDGGIYRALDGYLGLQTGSCSGTNQFDSLNQTLGSMTQFVSFSQHPTDANTLLGGTQDNGSPATASSQTSTQWLNVNSGDGGYNAINPNNANEWFTANTDVSIQRCTSGAACVSQSFIQVVGNATVGGDSGPFYTPYMLDPQNSGEMIVGTCRVWRGTTLGASFTVLTNNFETGSPALCTGSEVNQVRSLAAGGAKDASGFSKVIYAGTDAPSPGTAPSGGHVWVSTNAGGGTSTWVDRTGSINPGTFPISGIAMDTSDATGNTAYLAVMGFGVSHVWKTTNAGQSWNDFTGTGSGVLPDSPANAVIVDPGSSSTTGMVYVATDVGVFSSSTGTASWTEVGPAPGSGAGYLPNVSVTALRVFNSGGNKRLRASTYGRGVWEYNLITTPDFIFNIPSTQTIFPGQTATFNGTVTAINGYNSQVSLSCTGGKPSTCTPAPTPLTPTPSGVSLTVSTSGSVADYSFNLHAAGNDTGQTTHDVPLTLHVVDFNIGALSPSTISVNRPNTSQPVTFQVSALGSFNGTVDLACSGLPAAGSCNFSPSASVNPTASNPLTVTMTIGTTATTPAGTSTITVSANSTGAPAAKTQSLSLTVTSLPDYQLTPTTPPNVVVTATAGTQTTFTGTATAYNGYTSSISLSCGATAPPTCTIAPATLTPTPAGVPFTLTVGSNVVGNYTFNINGVGNDPSAVAHSIAVDFSSVFDFSVTPTPSPQANTVKAGTAATFNLDVNPAGGSFLNPVTFSCSGLPALSSCSFNPTQIAAGGGDTPLVLTVTTTAPVALAAPQPLGPIFATLLLPFPAIVLLIGRQLRQRNLRLLLLTLVLVLAGLQFACGGGGGSSGGGTPGQPGTAAGTYTITVRATSGPVSKTATVTLTVQ